MNTTSRLPAAALAAVFTLAMLIGVNALAGAGVGAAPQVALHATTAHS